MDSPQRLALSGLVILGGGTGQRLGGASKPDLVVRGRRALEWALASEPGIPHVCVVPETVTVPSDVIRVMEEPPRSGPAAGFIAGVQALLKVLPEDTESRWIGLVPVDAPLASLCFPLLLEAVAHLAAQGKHVDGVSACADGYRQNLIGVFSLEAVSRFPASEWVNRSMRSLLAELNTVDIEVPASWVADIDTPLDLERAQTYAMDGKLCVEGETSGE